MNEIPSPQAAPALVFYRLPSRKPCRACAHRHCPTCWRCHRCECLVYYKRPRPTRGRARWLSAFRV